jgi:hypothetical protein
MAGLGIVRLQPPLLPPQDLVASLPGRDRLPGPAGLADAGADLALGQRPLVRARGIAAVGPELARMDPGRGEALQQRQQVAPLVLVAGRERDRERQPARIDG